MVLPILSESLCPPPQPVCSLRIPAPSSSSSSQPPVQLGQVAWGLLSFPSCLTACRGVSLKLIWPLDPAWEIRAAFCDMGGCLLEETGYLIAILTPCIERQAAQACDAEGRSADSNLEHGSRKLERASFDLDLGKHVLLWLVQGPPSCQVVFLHQQLEILCTGDGAVLTEKCPLSLGVKAQGTVVGWVEIRGLINESHIFLLCTL